MADTVSVTQGDKEAAKAFWNRHIAGWHEQSEGQNALVQAFARHRLASTQPAPAFPRDEVADLIDALQRIAANRPSDPDSPQRVAREALSRAALLQGKQP